MKRFMDEDFLLNTETAQVLFHNYAEKLPIIDYHCHLSPKEIAEDVHYTNITEVWLYGDHYKWRAMRSCGIDEKYITGDASDFEKFKAYCSAMPKLIGNPLYHWSHLELQRYFDCDLVINEENCEEIWKIAAEKLAQPDMSAQQLITKSDVVLLCTTDDPADSLEYHKQLAESGFKTKVLPAFRPDKGMNIERKGIAAYLKTLSDSTGVEIVDIDSLEKAYLVSLDRFDALGCKTADHGMDDGVVFTKPDKFHANEALKKAIASDGADVSYDEAVMFKSQMIRFFGCEYKKRGWVMQLHYGVKRNPNSEMFAKLGPDSGFDTINGNITAEKLIAMLDYLKDNDGLPRTVIYSINPIENAAIGTMCGTFCAGDGSGKPTVTQGSAWWFNDNLDGMVAQMRSYANLSALGNFLGMLTDSRSFLSYPRHEYFRRILCRLIGEWVEEGMYPADIDALAQLVADISYNNTKDYFGFELVD